MKTLITIMCLLLLAGTASAQKPGDSGLIASSITGQAFISDDTTVVDSITINLVSNIKKEQLVIPIDSLPTIQTVQTDTLNGISRQKFIYIREE